jgi:hypothetical protein
MYWKRIAVALALAGSLATMPLADAAARPWHRHHWHHHHHGPGIWPFVTGAALLGTAAALTAPRWAPYPYPYPYYSPPAYYAPAPVYYYPAYNLAYPYR